MPCPHAPSGGEGRDGGWGRSQGLDRRDFVKAALAIGGSSALSACMERQGPLEVGSGDPGSVPRRQFAWNQYIPRDAHGNTVLPNHQLMLFFEYVGDGPTDSEREQVERALRSVERAYPWGNGGGNPYSAEGATVDGVLFTLGWSPTYFERTSGELPPVDLPHPETTLEAIGGDPAVADTHDAAMVLMSDNVPVLLSVEQALRGNLGEMNGVPVADSFDGVLAVSERRTGVKGVGLPRQELDDEDIPKGSPSAMGWKSGFAGNQATEDAVTIQEGPFAGGATQHVSELELDLDRWYDNGESEQVDLMFSPDHTTEQVGDVGEFLAADSGVTREIADEATEDARQENRVGHTQKAARARDDAFEPRILRRSEGVSTSHDGALNFTSIQRGIEAFVDVRKQMNESYDVPDEHNGIVDYLTTHARGNYLVPPRELRALPPARP
ncbi:MAG: hypothetical protein ABEH77_04295 [Halobacteriaceae archaeon]